MSVRLAPYDERDLEMDLLLAKAEKLRPGITDIFHIYRTLEKPIGEDAPPLEKELIKELQHESELMALLRLLDKKWRVK